MHPTLVGPIMATHHSKSKNPPLVHVKGHTKAWENTNVLSKPCLKLLSTPPTPSHKSTHTNLHTNMHPPTPNLHRARTHLHRGGADSDVSILEPQEEMDLTVSPKPVVHSVSPEPQPRRRPMVLKRRLVSDGDFGVSSYAWFGEARRGMWKAMGDARGRKGCRGLWRVGGCGIPQRFWRTPRVLSLLVVLLGVGGLGDQKFAPGGGRGEKMGSQVQEPILFVFPLC